MRAQTPPGRWVYVVAVLIAAAGLAICGAAIYHGVISLTHGFRQFVVPGETTITFERTGNYTIYHEYRSVIGNRIYHTDEAMSGLECEVRETGTGRVIPIRTARASSTYQIGGREGRGLFEVRIDKPGTYEFRGRYAPGFEGPSTVLAVGMASIFRFVALVFGGLAALFTCGIVALLIVLYTFVRRRAALVTAPPDKI